MGCSTRIRRSDTYVRAAIDYADRGWPVFLLGRTKRPVHNCRPCRAAGPDHDPQACDCLTCHGFYAATVDRTRIAAIFDAISDGLLAIRTGTVAGLVVVDIDPAHGGIVDPALMSPTAAVSTGGGGWHLYYRHPGGRPVPSRPLPGRPGVDIKADGGYVVAPPSIHPITGRPYRWVGGRPVGEMPPPLAAACLAETAPPRPSPGRPVTTDPPVTVTARSAGGISHPAALLAAHLDAVARAPQGLRRTTLYGAARGVARMVAAGALTPADAQAALTDAGRRAEQTDRDIRAAITGGFHDEGVPV
jgi:hypothetical protein